jgi:hypothetical protein
MQKLIPIIFVCLNILCLSKETSAQNLGEYKYKKLGITIGNGYEDGWLSLTKLPTIGMVYAQGFHKRFSVRLGITSFYRTMPDSYLYDDNNGNLITNIIVRDSKSPFISDKDREKITNVGIKDLNSSFTIKILSVPLDLGVMFTPIQYKRQQLGVFVGASLTFESQNWWRDYYPADLTLKDGTVYKSSFLALNTEFRSLTPGECLKVEYGYQFNRSTIALNISENNVLLSHPGAISFYNISIGLYAKI